MKQQFTIAAALVVALAGAGCAQSKPAENTDTQKPAVEQSADTGASIKWNEVSTAEEAAKGAGITKFGVLDEFDVGDLEFKNPKFAYAGGVAQATYETPATEVYVRKAVDEYTTPLSDRQLDEFSNRWHKVLEGVDVTCYGKARGAATVATWTDGDTSYAMTIQGLGGDEMSMTDEEVATIVKGFNEANAIQTQKDDDEAEAKTENKTTQSTAREGAASLISEEQAEAMAEKDCGGESVAIDRVVTKAYGECHYVVCVDEDGARFEYYVTNTAANLISKTEAQQQAKTSDNGEEQQSSNASSSATRKSGAKDDRNATRYEGQPTTICGSIAAEWHQTSDGSWAATFSTYNGTTVYATPVPGSDTGWFFHVNDNGQSVEVLYTEKDAQKGPAGETSHWKEANGNRWY